MDNNNAGLLSDEDISPQGELAQKQETKTVVAEDFRSATQETAPPESFDDKPYQKADWEKRYGDMRRYHDQVIKAKEDEIKSLMDQVNNGKEWTVPSSAEDIEKIKDTDPKLYEAIQKGSQLHYDAAVEKLKRDNLTLKKEAEIAKLKMVHPDVDDIKQSKEWKDWIKSQPEEIQEWVFKKLDSSLAAKAIDMFKKEVTMNTSDQAKETKDDSAADQVRTKQSVEPTQNDEHIFSRKEIDRMPPTEFKKYEEAIMSQWRRGLIK